MCISVIPSAEKRKDARKEMYPILGAGAEGEAMTDYRKGMNCFKKRGEPYDAITRQQTANKKGGRINFLRESEVAASRVRNPL